MTDQQDRDVARLPALLRCTSQGTPLQDGDDASAATDGQRDLYGHAGRICLCKAVMQKPWQHLLRVMAGAGHERQHGDVRRHVRRARRQWRDHVSHRRRATCEAHHRLVMWHEGADARGMPLHLLTCARVGA